MKKTKTLSLLLFLVGCASGAFAAKPFPAMKSHQAGKRSIPQPTMRMLPAQRDSRSSVIVGDKHFVIISDNCFKARGVGEVWLGPLGGDGVFIGPISGEGVFSGLLDKMVSGQLPGTHQLDDDFNIVLTPGDVASMQEQAFKTGDVEMLGLLIVILRQLDDLFWWTVDGANF